MMIPDASHTCIFDQVCQHPGQKCGCARVNKCRRVAYRAQSPQSGVTLSHRLFWVLHRTQAFFDVEARCLVLIVADTSMQTKRCHGLWHELRLIAKECAGAGRILRCLNALGERTMSARERQGWLHVRDLRDQDRDEDPARPMQQTSVVV